MSAKKELKEWLTSMTVANKDSPYTHQWMSNSSGACLLNIKDKDTEKLAQLVKNYIDEEGENAHDAQYSELCINERLSGTNRFALFMDLDFSPNQLLESGLASVPRQSESSRIENGASETLSQAYIKSIGSGGFSSGATTRYTLTALWSNIRYMIETIIEHVKQVWGEDAIRDHVVATRYPFTVHLHFPHVIVHEEMARMFRQFFYMRHEMGLPYNVFFQDLSDVYDAQVYSTGLRLVGSFKPGLRGNKNDENNKKLQKQKEYAALWQRNFDSTKIPQAYRPVDLQTGEPLPWSVNLIQRCMIRRPNMTPLTPRTNDHGAGITDETWKDIIQVVQDPDNEKHLSVKNAVHMDLEEHKVIKEYIEYQYNTDVVTMRMFSPSVDASHIIAVLDTKKCPFVKRTHTSNPQYVLLSAKGMSQRCYHSKGAEVCQGKKHKHIKYSAFKKNVKEKLKELNVVVEVIQNDALAQLTTGPRKKDLRVNQLDSFIKENMAAFNDNETDDSMPTVQEWLIPDYDEIIFEPNHVGCVVPLKELWCPICKREKDQPTNFLQLDRHGYLVVRCQETYRQNGGYLPKEPVKMDMYMTHFILDVPDMALTHEDRTADENDHNGLFVPGEYYEGDEDLNWFLYKSLSNNTIDLAHLIYYLSDKKFRVDKDDKWYVYNNTSGLWEKNGETLLPLFCQSEVVPRIKHVRKYYEVGASGKKCKDQKIAFDRIIEQLDNHQKRSNVIKDLGKLFRQNDPNFVQRLDDSPNLVAFDNGFVLDLDNNATVRPTRPTDWVSMNTKFSYDPVINEAELEEVENFFRQVQPDPHDREYLLCLLASGLHGEHPDELMHFVFGVTRNGKGVIETIMKNTLGDYCVSFRCEFFQYKDDGIERGSPILMNMLKVRFWIANEVDAGTVLNGKKIKFFTGTPYITGRFLHSNEMIQRCISPRIVVFSNRLPLFDHFEEALVLRLRHLYMPVSFRKDIDENKLYGVDPNYKGPYHAKVDETLKARLGTYRMSIMHLLIRYYRIYAAKGLVATPNIKHANMEREKECDPMKHWAVQCLKKQEGNSVTVAKAYHHYTEWHKIHRKGSVNTIYSRHLFQEALYSEHLKISLHPHSFDLQDVKLIQENEEGDDDEHDL